MRDKGNFKVFADNNSTWCEATIHDNAVNKWHHAVVIYTTNYMKVYVDGKEVANVHKKFDFNSSNNCDLVLGRLSSTWYPLHGCLDEFYVFNRELDEWEISSIYNNRTVNQAQQTANTDNVSNDSQPTGTPLTKPGKLPDSRHWNMIYSQSGEKYCNGVYGDKAINFATRLNNINRNHFRIVFNFIAKDNNSNPRGQWALMLSTGYRIIGVLLTPDGEIQISTNNQRNYYSTGIRYSKNTTEYIDLEFNNGTIIINGVTIKNVDMNRTDGDNTLTSINYSNGVAFHGIIKNVKVYNRK